LKGGRGEFEYQRSGEIGYWIAQEFWRKGVAYSALTQMSQYTFSNTGIVRIFASVFAGNTASMALLLKSGFQQEAVLQRVIFKNGQFYDNHTFAKIKSF
jgi:RimJ/RimL family protein N-acetyltransferase